LRKLIQEKEKNHGGKVTADEPKEAQVIDLMEALRRSLGEGGKARPAKTPAKRKRA
jgi:DNA end-binding protein Ku